MDALKDILGKTIVKIFKNNVRIRFVASDGCEYLMHHVQDCCESVEIEDVIGDLNDLLNRPITMAEEITSRENPEGIKKECQDSYTWTFYKLATIKGYVTIRWYGESNGYYSESVDFVKINAAISI